VKFIKFRTVAEPFDPKLYQDVGNADADKKVDMENMYSGVEYE